MKLWFLIVAAGAMWLSVRLPFEKSDVARLTPVSVLLVESGGGKVVIKSDQGNSGVGECLADALEDMELTSTGNIFFETVEQIIISEDVSVEAEELSDLFRPGTFVWACKDSPDVEEAGKYLQSQEQKTTLRDYEMGNASLPVLIQIDGRFYLDGEKN